MQKHENGDVTLKREEVQSLRKVLHACSWAINDLPSGSDRLGDENEHALDMWEDKLRGNNIGKLSWYIGEDGDEGNEEDEEALKKPTTVDEWLFDYGVGYR